MSWMSMLDKKNENTPKNALSLSMATSWSVTRDYA